MFFGLPKYNYRENETETSLQAILETRRNWTIPENGYYEVIGRSAISRVRNDVCAAFLKTDCEYLFFMDSDQTWIPRSKDEVNPIDRLISHSVDIISPAMTCRQLPLRVMYLWKHKSDLNLWDKKDIFEVDYTGSGFMLIKRKVIEAFYSKNLFAPFMPMFCPLEKVETSDDVAFCRRAKNLGFKIWVDPYTLIGHVGKYTFTVEDIKDYLIDESKKD